METPEDLHAERDKLLYRWELPPHPCVSPELAPVCAFTEGQREGGKGPCLSWAHLSTYLCTETRSALGKLAAGYFPGAVTSPRQWPALFKPTSPRLPSKPASHPSAVFPTEIGILGRATNSTGTDDVNANIQNKPIPSDVHQNYLLGFSSCTSWTWNHD